MHRGQRLKVPLPRNKTELELLSKWYFGKPLHVDLRFYESGGHYKVREEYNSYNGQGWLFASYAIEGYDYSWRFWDTILGPLGTGGIAGHSYGDFRVTGHRHKARLRALMRSNDRAGPDPVRQVFVRLAAQRRGRREWRDSR